jgi:arsenate reductase-like glutaredoxin family protein
MVLNSKLLITSLLFFILSGCVQDEDLENPVVASVYDYSLRKAEFESLLPKSYAKEDSAEVADQIINKWIREKAVLSLAEKNLSDENKDFTSKLEDYRNSLVIYTYERELVNQKLDTIVSLDETETFFNENNESFKLKNSILKPWFMSVSADAPNKDQLVKWFNGDPEEVLEDLDEYCKKYAEACFLDNEQWMYRDDLIKQIPLEVEDWSNFLQTNTYHEFELAGQLYLLRIFDYRLRGSDAPLELELEKVQNLIINQRKADLVKKMRDDAVKEAYAKNKIEWINK